MTAILYFYHMDLILYKILLWGRELVGWKNMGPLQDQDTTHLLIHRFGIHVSLWCKFTNIFWAVPSLHRTGKVPILTLLFTGRVNLGMLPNLANLPFPHLQDRIINSTDLRVDSKIVSVELLASAQAIFIHAIAMLWLPPGNKHE